VKPLQALMRRRGLHLRARCWLMLGHEAAALASFDRVLQTWPDDTHALASRAHLHGQAGRLVLALVDARHLVQLRPHQATAWFNLGFLLEADERWEEALKAFERATQLDPLLDRAWYGAGLVLIRLQRFDEAAAALLRNTALQPLSPHGWYQLARVHLDRQDPQAALKVIRHLQGFEPRVAAQLERETGLQVRAAGA
jgi:tetratricopeptide (TPR) repeat protein